jgi:hypothetical protein
MSSANQFGASGTYTAPPPETIISVHGDALGRLAVDGSNVNSPASCSPINEGSGSIPPDAAPATPLSELNLSLLSGQTDSDLLLAVARISALPGRSLHLAFPPGFRLAHGAERIAPLTRDLLASCVRFAAELESLAPGIRWSFEES